MSAANLDLPGQSCGTCSLKGLNSKAEPVLVADAKTKTHTPAKAGVCGSYRSELTTAFNVAQKHLRGFTSQMKKLLAADEASRASRKDEWCTALETFRESKFKKPFFKRALENEMKSYREKYDSLTQSAEFKAQCQKTSRQIARSIKPDELSPILGQSAEYQVKLSKIYESTCP